MYVSVNGVTHISNKSLSGMGWTFCILLAVGAREGIAPVTCILCIAQRAYLESSLSHDGTPL